MRTTPTESYKRYTDEQIEQANQTNIYELAKYRGYEVRDKSPKLAEIRYQGGLDLDRNNNKWYCYSARKGGGPIQLVMYMEQCSWLEAVQNILNEEGAIEVFRPVTQEEKTRKDFKLPNKNTTYRHMFAYLVKTRMIHPDIVNAFVKEHLIYENDKKSCIFVGKDRENIPRYAAVRGTNTIGNAFKGEVTGSDKKFGFARAGSNNILTIMEAPIDLLSYMTIYKTHGREKLIEKDHLLSLGGVSDVALEQYLYDHPEITEIKLGLDNDKAGNEACQKIYEKYSSQYKIRRIKMNQKDMNEVLKKDIERMVARAQKVRQEESVLEPEM